MSIQKLSCLSRSAALRNMIFPGTRSGIIFTRQKSHILASPPREKISTLENVITAIALGSSILSIPAWVIFHMNEYTEPLRRSA